MGLRKRKNPSKAPVCPDPFLLPNLLDGFDERKCGRLADDIKRPCDIRRMILNPYIEENLIHIDNGKNKIMKRENLLKPPTIIVIDADDELPVTLVAVEVSVNKDPNLEDEVITLEAKDKYHGGNFDAEVIILEDDHCNVADEYINMGKVGSATTFADVCCLGECNGVDVAVGDLADNSRYDIEEGNHSDDHCTIAEFLARISHRKVVAGDTSRGKDVNIGKVDRETTLADVSCLGRGNEVDVADGDLADNSGDDIEEGVDSDGAASPQINDVQYSAGNSIDCVGGNNADLDGGDDLSDIWVQMAFALESSKALEYPSADEHTEEQGGECHHLFIHKDDLGEVCRVCGLVQRHIRSIIEVAYSKLKKSTRTCRRNPQELTLENHITARMGKASLAYSHTQSSQINCLAPKISVHPTHQKQKRPHQIEGFNFLCKNLVTGEPGGCILAHAPGSGKTFLVISFLQSFMAVYPDARPLIVLPRGIIETWKGQFMLWQVENIPLLDFYGAKAESRAQQLEVLRKWVGEQSILLLGYKQFSSIIFDPKNNQISAKCQKILLKLPTVLILDEGHTSRNEEIDVLQSLTKVQKRRKVVLSGTLFQNHVKEVFSILNLVRPKFLKFPDSQDIVTRIMSKVEMSSVRKHGKVGNEAAFFDGVQYTLQESANSSTKVSVIKDLHEMTRQVLHYHKADFQGELPGLLEFTVTLNLTTMQSDEVKRLRKLDKFKQIPLGSVLYMHPKLQAFLQKSPPNGARGSGFDDEKINVQDGVKKKFFLNILRLCESTGEKLLVFSQYVLPMKVLERLLCDLKGWSLGKELFRITGHSSTEQREWSIERFNNSPDARVFFGSIKACGEGISLVGASRVLILDAHLNPSVTHQASCRFT